MSGYLKQKLFQALHDLVAAGDIDERPEIKTDRASHAQAKGHLEQTPAGRGLKAKTGKT